VTGTTGNGLGGRPSRPPVSCTHRGSSSEGALSPVANARWRLSDEITLYRHKPKAAPNEPKVTPKRFPNRQHRNQSQADCRHIRVALTTCASGGSRKAATSGRRRWLTGSNSVQSPRPKREEGRSARMPDGVVSTRQRLTSLTVRFTVTRCRISRLPRPRESQPPSGRDRITATPSRPRSSEAARER